MYDEEDKIGVVFEDSLVSQRRGSGSTVTYECKILADDLWKYFMAKAERALISFDFTEKTRSGF